MCGERFSERVCSLPSLSACCGQPGESPSHAEQSPTGRKESKQEPQPKNKVTFSPPLILSRDTYVLSNTGFSITEGRIDVSELSSG